MSCEKFDKLINLFLDKRLKSDEERELKEHLSGCERCQQKLSLLELVEGSARRIEAKEPPKEYWGTLFSRVKEKIVARQERSLVFRWKKAFQNILTFSPLKIRIAAGLVSILLVFIIGKLYVEYRGEKIVPSAPTVRIVEKPILSVPEIEKKEATPKEVDEKKTKPAEEKPQIDKEPIPIAQPETKGVLKEEVTIKEEPALEEAQPLPSPQIREEKAIPPPAPLESQDKIEAEKPSPPAPEAKPVGAGAEKVAEQREVLRVVLPKEGAKKTEDVYQKGEAHQQIMKDVTSSRLGFISPLVTDYYVVNGQTIQKIKDDDTLIQMDELRRVIQTWRTHIQEKPTDSLSQIGYLQVAIGYYLLSKLTQDSTVISEGTKSIEEYLIQVKEPTIKDQLNERLEKIKALGRK